MAPVTLPPGFRFHPTDEELVTYYLDRKIKGEQMELEIIPEVDLYKCEPWDLPGKSLIPSKDMEWYFFSSRDRKYPNGSRTNRATKGGYWKATGKDRMVLSNRRTVGMKKTLVYYGGRAPHGIRTDWVMHEYRVLETAPDHATAPALKDTYALCRIFKKFSCKPKTNASQSEALKDKWLGIPDEELVCDEISGNNVSLEEEVEGMHKQKDDAAKFSPDSSSSEVTQEILMDRFINVDEAKVLIPLDEANSSTTDYSQYVNLEDPLKEKTLGFIGMQSQLMQNPPLAVDDFPQMGVIETRQSKFHSMEDYMKYGIIFSSFNESRMLDDHIFYMASPSHSGLNSLV